MTTSLKESTQIQRLQTSLEIEIRDMEEFLKPYERLLKKKRKQLKELEAERLEAEKQEYIQENGVTKKKKKQKSEGENSEDESSKSEKHLINKLMANLNKMSKEEQDELLKRYNLK